MKFKKSMGRVAFALVALLAPALNAATLYSETVNGDLSGNRLAPTSRTLAVGDNDLFATTSGGDQEYLTLIVPANVRLSQLFLRSYVSPDFNAFIGFQNGSTFTVDPSFAQASDMRGYAHFGTGSGNIGQNILPSMGTAFQAQGFTPPLPSGSYTYWIQQLGGTTTYQFDFVGTAVPEPAALGLILAACPLLARRRR